MNIRQLTGKNEQTLLSSNSNAIASDYRPNVLAVVSLTVVVAIASSLLTLWMSQKRLNPTVQASDSSSLATSNPAIANPDKSFVIEAIAASGYLEPQGEIIRLSAPAFQEGTRVEELLVGVGDRVDAGDVVAILDSRDRLTAALNLAQRQVTIAQAELDRVKAGAKQGAIDAQSATVKRLMAELDGQTMTQNALIAKLDAELEGEQQAQAATLDRFNAELANAKAECQRYLGLHEQGAVSASLYESTCLREETVREQLQEAEANLTRTVNTLNQDIAEAEANLTRTVTTLRQQISEANASLDEVSEVRPVDVAIAQAKLGEAIAAVDQAQANLELAFIKTPQAGQILNIHTLPGELMGQDGVVDLGQTRQMYAVAEVYETDIVNVKLGQTATITSEGFQEELTGIVDEIGLLIDKNDVLSTDPAADVDARVVEVKIRLDEQDSEHVSGLTNLEIHAVIDITTP